MTSKESVLIMKQDELRDEIRKRERLISNREQMIHQYFQLYDETLDVHYKYKIGDLKYDIRILKFAITELEDELSHVSQELYLERAAQRKAEKPRECDYFYGQDDICLVNELLKNGIIRGIKF